MNQIADFPREPLPRAAPHRRHDPSRRFPIRCPSCSTGEDLPIEDAEHLFERLVLGKLEPAEIAGMLIALRMKGETAEEMIGAARALQRRGAAVRPARLSLRRLLRHRRRRVGADQRLDRDRLRRGGVRACRSPSTAIAASARAAARPTCSRRSARRSTLPPEKARALLDETGFCFLFAPAYHPGHEACGAGPAAARGADDHEFARPLHQSGAAAGAAARRRRSRRCCAGSRRRSPRWALREALVVHGSGLDEVALHGETRAIRLSGEDDRGARDHARGCGPRAGAAQGRDRRRRRGECGAAAGAARRPRRARGGGHRHPQHRRAAARRRARRRPCAKAPTLAREALASGARRRSARRGIVEASRG